MRSSQRFKSMSGFQSNTERYGKQCFLDGLLQLDSARDHAHMYREYIIGFLLIGGFEDKKTIEFYYPLAEEIHESKQLSRFLQSVAQPVDTELLIVRQEAISALLPDGRVLIAAGSLNAGGARRPYSSSEILDPETMQLTPGPNMNTACRSPGSAVLDGRVFVCGGSNDDGYALQTCEVFKNGAWWTHKSMNTARSALTLEALDDSLYAIGGEIYPVDSEITGSVLDAIRGEIYLVDSGITDSVEMYSFENRKWTNVASMSMRRGYHISAVLNGAIYVCGGFTERGHSNAEKQCERYLPDENRWENIEALNHQRSYAMMVAHLGRLYVVGGGDEMTVESFDPEKEKKWVIEGEISSERRASSIVIIPMTRSLELSTGAV